MCHTIKPFAKHLTSEDFSIFPVAYWAKVSELGDYNFITVGALIMRLSNSAAKINLKSNNF